MDDKRFDSLSRQVGQHADRRTMVKTALGGTLALLGLGGLGQPSEARNRRNNNGRRRGFEDDTCETSDDCRSGLRCQGAKTGIAPGFPTPIPIPVITGQSGTCRYRQGCGGEQGDACKNNGDCCNNLTCDNNHCKENN